MGLNQRQLVLLTEVLAQQGDQSRIINGEQISRWCLDVDHEIGGSRVERGNSGPERFSFGEVGRLPHLFGMAIRGPVQKQLFLLPSGQIGKALRRRRTGKGVKTIAVKTGEADKGLLEFFTAHALDWIPPQAFDLSDDFHLSSLVYSKPGDIMGVRNDCRTPR